MRFTRNFRLFVLLPLAQFQLTAAIIGTNVPSTPLSQTRINSLPEHERSAWSDYLSHSTKQSRTDRAFLIDEMRSAGTTNAMSPPPGRGTRGLALDNPSVWYSTDEAHRIAQIIVSFQTPAGGWSKNLDMTHHRRASGELFAHANASRFATPADLDMPGDPGWNYVGTFDNGATITQLRFLAKVISASDTRESATYQKSFLRGLDYIFASQFPNGGWPQVWPLQGGYHDCVTFNDGAMTGILDLLLDVSAARQDFHFVTQSIRQKSADALHRGIRCILATQVISNNKPAAWCQQYDALTLAPASARNYEMPSLSSGESAGVMQFLMRIAEADTNINAAIHSTAAWFQSTAIHNKAYRRTEANDGRHLVDAPGSHPLWARYYRISDSRPIFGERDKSIHDTVEEISRERRDGYAWFSESPQDALKKYASWKK
jgi:PelA/Pel-15E family pectate lyase